MSALCSTRVTDWPACRPPPWATAPHAGAATCRHAASSGAIGFSSRRDNRGAAADREDGRPYDSDWLTEIQAMGAENCYPLMR